MGPCYQSIQTIIDNAIYCCLYDEHVCIYIFRYNVSVIISSRGRVRKIKSCFQAYYVPILDMIKGSTLLYFMYFYVVSKQLRRKSHMTLLHAVFTKMLKSSYCNKVHVYAFCALS